MTCSRSASRGRGLAHRRPLRGDRGRTGREYDKRAAAREGGRWGEQAGEPRCGGGGCDRLSLRVVVADQVGISKPDRGTCSGVGQIQHLQPVDLDSADTAAQLKRGQPHHRRSVATSNINSGVRR